LAARFEADLAALATRPAEGAPRAALYQAGGWSAGRASLPGEVLAAAGLGNVAEELGLAAGGFLPLEALVMAAPDLVVTGQPWPGASRAEERAAHPALQGAGRAATALTDRDWVCGLPQLLGPIAAMVELRRSLEAGR
jgi:iron complex transport system substrate-binding protein